MSNGTEDETEFECPVCGDTFDTEEDRDEHLIQLHPD
ncbi:MAG: C4-type Zn-finger protein [Natronomonas sp.]|jgi:C4-type Zn-finger protein